MRTTHPALALLLAWSLLAGCAGPGGGHASTGSFACLRKGFSIAYTSPAGWPGPPNYADGPALDSWTFSAGPDAPADSLETRVYDAKDSPLRWDTASDAEVLANFEGAYVNPRVERLDTVAVDGHPARVFAVYSDGVDEYLASVYYGDNLVQVMVTSNTPAGLARRRGAYLAFLRSMRFEQVR